MGTILYIWEPGSIASQSYTAYLAGTYSLTTYDSYGCSASTSISITTPSPMRDSIVSATNLLCHGDNTGAITLGVNRGSPTYTYSWSNGATTSNLSGLSVGTYSVLVQDKCGSTVTATVTITKSLYSKDSITLLSQVPCFGNTGSATIGAVGGSGIYTYSWSPAGGSSATASNLSAGSYTVTVTDANGCVQMTTAIIKQPLAALSCITTATNISCNGTNDGIANVNVSGGTPNYNYSWNPGGQSNATVNGLSAGIYTVTVTDSAGCIATSSVTLTQPTAISESLSSMPATCVNNDGSITVSVLGGIAPYSYLWNPGGGTAASYTGLSGGTYKVIVTDAQGCMDTISGNIAIINNLTVSIAGIDSMCKGQSIVLTASGASSYLWSYKQHIVQHNHFSFNFHKLLGRWQRRPMQ